MHSRPMSRDTAKLFAAGLAFAVFSCGGGGGAGGGCGGSCMEPLPGGFKGEKTKNAIVTRISPDGFSYLNTNWKTLISTVMTTAKPNPSNASELLIPFSFPCTMVPNPGFGVGDILSATTAAAARPPPGSWTASATPATPAAPS